MTRVIILLLLGMSPFVGAAAADLSGHISLVSAGIQASQDSGGTVVFLQAGRSSEGQTAVRRRPS